MTSMTSEGPRDGAGGRRTPEDGTVDGREGDVRENLISAALTLLGANGPAIAAAAISRHAVAERVRRAWAAGAPGPGAVEEAMARYVEGEQRLGRISADADGAMLALALAGTVHHLLMHGSLQPGENARLVRRLVTALVPTANGLGASA